MQTDKIWLSSDFHLKHKNMIEGTSSWTNKSLCRKFKSIESHDDWVLNDINGKVGQDDTLYFLGDFSFGGIENIKPFRERIVCKNIHFLIGNHDQHIEANRDNLQKLFSSVQYYLELPVSKSEKLIMMHYPIASWRSLQKGYPHVYGHQHSGNIGPGRCMDIGMDARGILKGVYSLEEVLDTLMKRPVINNHHDSIIEVK